MGKSKKNIDQVFKMQMRNYTQAAPEDAWENIEQVLNKKNNSRIISLYKIAATVAAFAIVGSGLFYLSNNSNIIDNSQVIVQNDIQKETSSSISNSIEEKVVAVIDKDLNKNDSNVNRIELTPKKESVQTVKAGDAKLIADERNLNKEEQKLNKLLQKQILISTKNIELAIVDSRKQNINSYLNTLPEIYSFYAHNETIEIEKTKKNKWFVGGEFTPLYSYRNITETQGVYNKDFYNSSESPIMSYTGGLNIQYKAISRLTIQAGVYYSTMGQSLDYLSVYANSAYDMVADEYKDRLINSYSIENSSGDLSFNSSHVIIDEKSARINNHTDGKRVADVKNPIFNELDAEIQQSFQYVEVPVIFRYTLIDKNIDLNIIGGFGANFLVGNDVYINYAGNKEVIGETNGVSPINYNGTLGIGIEYPLMENINIRLEPSIKYYLNELNSTSPIESHPYSIGIYTGINYSF
ncbi:MAG: outer membrane beta-barrel protein [Bacteroidales bacterium]|nr:outer membrane beta-barrel protein [Bacteroidales bacterium]